MSIWEPATRTRKRKFKLKPYVPTELEDQQIIFAWAKLHEQKHPELKLLHSTLNGIRLPIGLAVKAKRSGNKPGCPDIYLDVARHGFHGLRMELKRTKGGRLTEDQEWWIGRLVEQHYKVEVPKGAQEAITCICDYLGIKE